MQPSISSPSTFLPNLVSSLIVSALYCPSPMSPSYFFRHLRGHRLCNIVICLLTLPLLIGMLTLYSRICGVWRAYLKILPHASELIVLSLVNFHSFITSRSLTEPSDSRGLFHTIFQSYIAKRTPPTSAPVWLAPVRSAYIITTTCL